MRKTLALVAILGLAACTDSEGARRTAENHGLTEVRITGYRFFGCSKDDLYHTGFEARAPNGRRVTGVVCSTFFKSNTLRLD